jgi:ribosome-binding protein aMBF1 (putative translation factor)
MVMIKNERQYRITKAQIADLEQALATTVAQPEGPPQLQHAEEEALRSQIADLRVQVEEYEALVSGERPVLTLESFEELPRALIQARIAAGLSHKELAERLRLKEQQIQRYEATDYASASLERVQEVIRALGVRVREDVILPKAKLSFDRLLTRLNRAGLDSDFVLARLIPRTLRARLEDPQDTSDPDTLVLRVASAIGRVFGWTPATIFGPGPLQPNMAVVGATRYKTTSRVDEQWTSAYTLYAHFLALLVLEATTALPRQPIPTDPRVLREAIVTVYGSLTFEHALRYIWGLGIPVLPLADAGAFHGACWRVDGRNIIVLKQSVRSPARWLFDLMHEVYHAGQHPEQPELMVVEHNELAKERLESEEEQEASQFAGDVLLNGRAEALAQQCVRAAGGSVERLKKALPQVAAREQVRPDALANYMAFRLSLQGENWWGAANNLQATAPDPWLVARDLTLEHINLSVLNEADRSLLLQALSERT